jgi:dihydrofolate reductase
MGESPDGDAVSVFPFGAVTAACWVVCRQAGEAARVRRAPRRNNRDAADLPIEIRRDTMRPLVLQMGITLDGFVHGAEGYGDWDLPPEEDEVVTWKVRSLRQAGTHIMGRRTYTEMASVWPVSTGVYAEVMNEIPKVVFSKTLTEADWADTRIAAGDLRADIERLKGEAGGIVLAHGGATFIDALIGEGLIDEYRLVIHPVAIGHGRPLFGALPAPYRLDLVEARSYPSGTAIHVYRPHARQP